MHTQPQPTRTSTEPPFPALAGLAAGLLVAAILGGCNGLSEPPSLRLSSSVVQAVDASGTVVDTIDTGGPIHTLLHGVGTSGTRVAYAARRSDSLLRVIDPRRRAVVDTLRLDTQGRHLDVHPDGREVYVADEEKSVLRIRSLPNNTIRAEVPVGIEPEAVRTSPDGRWVAVGAATSRTVSLVQTDSAREVAIQPIPGRPVGLAFAPGGERLTVYTAAPRDTLVWTVPALQRVDADQSPR